MMCLVRQSNNFMFAAPLAPEICVADRGALVKFPRSMELPVCVGVRRQGVIKAKVLMAKRPDTTLLQSHGEA
jgi:hypothetical protein